MDEYVLSVTIPGMLSGHGPMQAIDTYIKIHLYFDDYFLKG